LFHAPPPRHVDRISKCRHGELHSDNAVYGWIANTTARHINRRFSDLAGLCSLNASVELTGEPGLLKSGRFRFGFALINDRCDLRFVNRCQGLLTFRRSF